MNIAIIGGGAAGCFAAIEIKRRIPDATVTIFEAGRKALAKVAITGGGRCNLTNTFNAIGELKQAYPRGDKLMRRALATFSERDVWQWFENEGVRLVAQSDECVFPMSQNAMEIVNTLLSLCHNLGVKILTSHRITKITPAEGSYDITATGGTTGKEREYNGFDTVIVTTGGHPKASGFEMLSGLDIKIESPVPSLFTFNIAGDWHQQLMGTVVEDASVMLCGTKLRSRGPLLLTHWGMSGPAILRLSSYAARNLAESDYKGMIAVNWCGESTEDDVRKMLAAFAHDHGQKLITSAYPSHLTSRHWQVLLTRAGIPPTQRWNSLNAKQTNRLVSILTADQYTITGRCHFKEEFVTCGGVSLKSININTMESRCHPRLFFAGEVLDVDAITGGFNLQAAWSMAMVVAREVTV